MKKIAWVSGLVLLGFMLYNLGNTFLFNLDFVNINLESLRQRFSEVHFVGPGNSFGGAIFWLDAKNLTTPQIIEYGTGATYEKKSCMTQVRGIYYNNQRGLRLWPLDQTSLAMLNSNGIGYNNLSMTGGFYRNCTTLVGNSNSGEIYSIYGYIEYTLTGTTSAIKSYLVAGVKLNFVSNSLSTGLTNNFQYFNNTTPLGYIYDSNGGIGFVGGNLSGHLNLITYLNNPSNTINDAFQISGISIVSTSNNWTFINISGINTAQDTLWNLMVQGTVGLSKSINQQQRISLLGNPDKRTVLYGGTEINSSTILNLVRQNAQNLCRGKTRNTSSTLPISNDPIICQANDLIINLALDRSKYENKTIIVSAGSNVFLTGSMKGNYNPVEIFVEKGFLFLDNGIIYESFNPDGYPASTNLVSSGMYLKGNFIINGLILGGNSLSTITGFTHKLHVEGKVVSLNSPLEPSQGRLNQIMSLFGSPYTYTGFVNLANVFVWTCSFAGIGSDNTPCGNGGITSLVPFVILNGNFKSNLF